MAFYLKFFLDYFFGHDPKTNRSIFSKTLRMKFLHVIVEKCSKRLSSKSHKIFEWLAANFEHFETVGVRSYRSVITSRFEFESRDLNDILFDLRTTDFENGFSQFRFGDVFTSSFGRSCPDTFSAAYNRPLKNCCRNLPRNTSDYIFPAVDRTGAVTRYIFSPSARSALPQLTEENIIIV